MKFFLKMKINQFACGTTTHALVSSKSFHIINVKKEFPEIYSIMEKMLENN